MGTEGPGWSALLSRAHLVYIVILGGGVMLYALDIYIAATVLPSAVKDIGGLDYYAWSTTLFVIAAILGSAFSGRLLQVTGPRGAYSVAALVFAVGTAICAMAPSMPVMLTGRVLQGFGGGALYALAYVVIRLVLPEALWTRAIGLMSAIWGVATLIGPAVGGTFAEMGAWRFAFWVAIPFSATFAVLAFVVLPKRDGDKAADGGLPFVQIGLLILAVLVLSSASAAPSLVWNIVGAALSLVLVALLVFAETRSARRILPSGAHGFATPLAAVYATMALLIIGMQPQIFVPYFLQVLHGQSPLAAGYLAALTAMGWTLGSVFNANASAARARRLIVASPLMMVAALGTLAVMLPMVSKGGDWAILLPICAALLLAGVGIGQSWPHLVARVFQFAPEGERNRAAGAVTTVQLFAMAMGAATAGLAANLAGLTQADKIVGAASAAFWLPLAFALAPALAFVAALRAVAQRTRAGLPFAPEERVDGRAAAG